MEPVELRPTIDRAWLERRAAAEPLTHAYAVWDLERTPGAVRFVSACRGGETVGYLLVWLGIRDRPVVHWFGDPSEAAVLADAVPAPPLTAVVPPDAAPLVVRRFPTARRTGLRLMLHDAAPPAVDTRGVRRLGRADRPALEELTRQHRDPELAAYADLDPGAEAVWGAFDGPRLTGVARGAVRLPAVWVLGGVFVVPPARGQGLGRQLVGAVIAEAARAGARTGLYVRDEPGPAAHLYEQLGFREVGRRVWLDVRAERDG